MNQFPQALENTFRDIRRRYSQLKVDKTLKGWLVNVDLPFHCFVVHSVNYSYISSLTHLIMRFTANPPLPPFVLPA
jgi:hypothetical protein